MRATLTFFALLKSKSSNTKNAGSLCVMHRELMSEQYKTYAYFWISDFECDPKDISHILGLVPYRTFQKGGLINESTKTRWKHSGWEIRSVLPESTPCQDTHIESLLSIMLPKKQELLSLSKKYEIGINCVGYYYGANPGFHLSAALIKSCAELGVSIDFDLYNNDGILEM
jgi:hypothetical protein